MFKSYFKIAARVLVRNKVYVGLNLLGLGFALACCLLAFLNWDYHARFDQNFSNTSSVYRINSKRTVDGGSGPWALTPAALSYTLQNQSGVKQSAQLFSRSFVVKKGEATFSEQVYFTDASFFRMFQFPLSSGNINTIEAKNNLILSEGYAEKYFNTKDAVGKQLTLLNNDGTPEVFTVAAVMAPIPSNSSFQFNIVTAASNFGFNNTAVDWRTGGLVSTFIEVSNNKNISVIERNLQQYTLAHNAVQPDWKIDAFTLQPFNNIALSSDRDMSGYVNGSPLAQNNRGVSVIGPLIMCVFILLIACFNFTNISIAFAGGRLKEIGIRKVLGGMRAQLIKQFLAENTLLCLTASLLSFCFVAYLLPRFNAMFGTGLELYLLDYRLWLLVLGLPLITAIISGLYPALYISGFEPVAILKGQSSIGSSNRFSRILLVMQFAVSCLALLLGFALSKNADYQQKVDFGYRINEVAVANVSNASEYAVMSNALRTHTAIKSISGTQHQVGEGGESVMAKSEGKELKVQRFITGGESYFNTMGMQLLSGRHFYAESSLEEKESVIVNETFAAQLQLKNPVGQTVWLDSANRTIIGVVKDYKENGLHGKIPPIALQLASSAAFQFLVVQSSQASINEVYKKMQETWHQVLPGKPFNGFLQKELIDKDIYLNAGFKSVSFFLAAATILLSASGVFALVSLNIIRRKKEIGMHKILGASALQIVGIINKDFIKVLVIAFIIGASIGYLIIDKIVFRYIYAYHADLGISVFLFTLLIIVLSSVFTIGFKVYQAANASPVKNLRPE